MACSKYNYERGYEDNRFEIVVSQRFHCPICFLVLKDPVMCKNEHYYCSSCMKKHLESSSFCPTCLEPLTVDTLKPAARIVNDYLSELNIRCDFYPRGCPEMVQVENLKRHVASCGFSPVQCSNEGCDAVVNASDKHQHETEVCDFRKVKCHDCGQLKNEVREMKDQIKNEMKGMKDEMNNGMKVMKEEINDEMKGVKEMIDQVLVHQHQMQDKVLNEVSQIKDEMKGMIESKIKGMIESETRGMKEEMKNEIKEKIKIEMKGMKEEMKAEMKEIVMNAVRDAVAGINNPEVEMKNSSQGSQATCSSDARKNIFLVGGHHYDGLAEVNNKSTECFNWADQTWTSLDSAVFEGRRYTCSFMYQGQMVVAGGIDNGGNRTNTMKCLNVADPAATWKDFAVNFPVKCSRHKVVNHNDQLFMSGGYVAQSEEPTKRSDAVFEMQLVPPYSSKILTRLPRSRLNHGMEMFDQKLFILGGYDGQITASVVKYDLIKNKCKEMPPLPYAVKEMATVLWRNNVLVIGGLDRWYHSLNKIAMYDVITGHSQMLPYMKHKRYGCTAVLTGNVVVVMGGKNEKGDCLKSVECFDLERQVWQDLPDLLEPRAYATAVVKPNH